MQDRLVRHFAEAEAVVLGVRLRPFSLWHWRTLGMLGSPFTEGEIAEDEDLLLAVEVCRLKPFSRLKFLRAGWWRRLRMDWRRWLYRPAMEEQHEIFEEYLAHYYAGPQVVRRQNAGSSEVKSHPAMYLAAGLRSMGFGDAEAWSMTPGLARWWIAAGREFAGDELNIVSEQMIRDAIEAGYTTEEMGL